MPDREKVIRGLLACAEEDSCDSCPYEYIGCRATLAEDAIALLKAQEARVMSLDDVCVGGECWIEYKYGGCGYADVYLSDHPDGTARVYRCRPVGDNKPETVWLNDYGKFWRGWTSRPTDAQRKVVKWDG